MKRENFLFKSLIIIIFEKDIEISTFLLVFTSISLGLWIVFFITTIFFGNAAVSCVIFFVIWISSLWIDELKRLVEMASDKNTSVDKIILEHYQ